MELNQIYNESCLTGLEKVDFPVHLVVTSPPYNVNLGNNKLYKQKYDVYKDLLEPNEYYNFISDVFRRVWNVQEDDGRVCINVGDQKNGEIPLHVYYTQIMEQIGYHTYTTIVWERGKPGFGQTGNRTSWGSFNSPSCPSFPLPFEYILCFYKNSKKLLRKGNSDLEKREFIDWSLSLWSFLPETRMRKIGHPAMFPEELPKRLIKMFSYVGDTVLDPFSGAGTTSVVAKKLKRNYVGFEISENYCNITNKRLSEANNETS